jgi:hypothetical protein
MKKPTKPKLKGKEPQLVKEQLGYFENTPYGYPVPYLDSNLNINIDWPDGHKVTDYFFDMVSLGYIDLGIKLKALGYVSYQTEPGYDNESRLYGYRLETEEEISTRLIKENELENKYEAQLLAYKDWLKQELDNS